jgi:hypothetical protein
MTGDLENKAALDHPGNAVVIPLTVGFDPWEAHELGGDNNTTNSNSVTTNRVELGIISTFSTCPSSPPVKKAPRYAQERCRTIDPNYRQARIVRVRSPREAQKRRMQGWSDCRFILSKLTLEGLRQVAITLAQEGQRSPWPKERRRYARTKSHLVGEALDDFLRKLGFPEFCVEEEQR